MKFKMKTFNLIKRQIRDTSTKAQICNLLYITEHQILDAILYFMNIAS